MVINDQRHPESIRFLKIPFISHSSPNMSPLVQRLLVAQIAKKIRPNKSVRLKNKAPFAGFSDLRGREGDGCDGYQESMGDQSGFNGIWGCMGYMRGLNGKKNWILILIYINGIWGFSRRYNQQSDIWMCVWKWVLPGIWQFIREMMRNHGIRGGARMVTWGR